jgi:hypothetical protein
MPRRELLTPAERVELFAFPADEGELIRLATLSKSDLAFIRQHRGLPNRLGAAPTDTVDDRDGINQP